MLHLWNIIDHPFTGDLPRGGHTAALKIFAIHFWGLQDIYTSTLFNDLHLSHFDHSVHPNVAFTDFIHEDAVHNVCVDGNFYIRSITHLMTFSIIGSSGSGKTTVRVLSDTYAISLLIIISQFVAHASGEGWDNVNHGLVSSCNGPTTPIRCMYPNLLKAHGHSPVILVDTPGFMDDHSETDGLEDIAGWMKATMWVWLREGWTES